MVTENVLSGVAGTGREAERTSPTPSSGSLGERLTGSSVEENQFMTILLEQLKNQNPLDPMSNEKFVSQMAQLTSLEQMTKMTDAFQSMNQSAQARQYLSVLGKEVSVTRSGGSTVTGTVKSVTFGDGETLVSIGGKDVPTNEILSIGTTDSSGESSPEES